MDENNTSFTSFGLVVLDEIRFPDRKPLTNVLGGSGAYATLGARLFLPSPLSRSLAWPIHVGDDFPDSIAALLRGWDTNLLIARELDQPSTRGLLEYQDTTFGPKSFKYTTPILAIQKSNLQSTALLTSKVYHHLASPQDMRTRVLDILTLREETGISTRPLIIWEPAPLSCKPENLQEFLAVAALVDVFSPNHLELAAMCGIHEPVSDKAGIEALALKFRASGIGPEGTGAVVVRAGENGCFVLCGLISQWLPPFYTTEMIEGQDSKVIDPTGAGNAFLGAFSIGYLQTGGDIIEAACYGSVAASFALEQVGMPEKSNEGYEELWNGVSVLRRLHKYRARLGVVAT